MSAANDDIHRAIHEAVALSPYDASWPLTFRSEATRLAVITSELLAIEHIGSTAVPGMVAKPVIDLLAAVPSMTVADVLVDRLCAAGGGYTTSAEFNASLGDRRWIMRHANGHRTHHLHLVLPGSTHWIDRIHFRDLLRSDTGLAADYIALKHRLAIEFHDDREAYTHAKATFIAAALAKGPLPAA